MRRGPSGVPEARDLRLTQVLAFESVTRCRRLGPDDHTAGGRRAHDGQCSLRGKEKTSWSIPRSAARSCSLFSHWSSEPPRPWRHLPQEVFLEVGAAPGRGSPRRSASRSMGARSARTARRTARRSPRNTGARSTRTASRAAQDRRKGDGGRSLGSRPPCSGSRPFVWNVR